MTGEDGGSRIPLYVRLAQLMRQDVRAGAYAAGEILPGERVLAGHYGCSPETARKSVRMLKDEGVVKMRRGIGYEVQELPPRAVVEIGPGDSVEMRVPADAERERLKLPAGVPVFVVRRQAGGAEELYSGNDTRLIASN
jgi:DNA-binding GntR family transcriptional regulator